MFQFSPFKMHNVEGNTSYTFYKYIMYKCLYVDIYIYIYIYIYICVDICIYKMYTTSDIITLV